MHLHSSTVAFSKLKQAHTKVSVKRGYLCVQLYWTGQGGGPWQQDGKSGILGNTTIYQQTYWSDQECTLSSGMAALLLAVLWFFKKWDSSYTWRISLVLPVDR